jgi:hypothetical protein
MHWYVVLFGITLSQRKVADNTLNVNRMNVGSRSNQPVMRGWICEVQKLVDENGVIQQLKAKDMHLVLKAHPYFSNRKNVLQEFLEERGCMPFLPKVSLQMKYHRARLVSV